MIQTIGAGATQHPQEIFNFLASFLCNTGGVLDRTGNDLKVTQDTGSNLYVKVKQGRAYIPQANGLMAFPVYISGADESIQVTANGSGFGRKDIVVAYINTSWVKTGETPVDETVEKKAKLTIVQGTPSASPQYPSDSQISTALGNMPFIKLGGYTLASGATAVTNAMIEDFRLNAEFILREPKIVGSKQNYTTLTDGATIEIDLAKGSKFQVVMGGNRAFTLKAPVTGTTWAGKMFILRLTQDATGSRTISSLFSGYTISYADGVAPVLTTTPNKTDKIAFEVLDDGTTIEVSVISQNH